MGCLMGKEEMAGLPMPYAANYNYPNQGYGGYQQVYEQQYRPGQVCQSNRYENAPGQPFCQDRFSYNQPSPRFYANCRPPTVPEPVQCRPVAGYDPYAQPGYTQPGYSQMGYGAPAYGQDVLYQQSQGMSSGAKMVRAGAVFAAHHAGDIAQFAEGAADHAGDIVQFAEGAFDDVGRFAGDAAHGVEEFVEDYFY
ncbi:hypothetical protein AK812_SmicGene26714 [Symbiodinium microadriaticum]|uniref:Uncharacterized protein n=1 Tax=Symbiodinium microadriaticum TaxID=2951 RepID=A0A1Q9D8R8_SYMMI|nr:hypothetical protein AK812_SmicGene26714 [Symbiodinium microadriaticum]